MVFVCVESGDWVVCVCVWRFAGWCVCRGWWLGGVCAWRVTGWCVCVEGRWLVCVCEGWVRKI